MHLVIWGEATYIYIKSKSENKSEIKLKLKLKIVELDPFVFFHHPIQSAYISSRIVETWSYI